MKIITKIHTYLETHSVQDLLNAVWVASSTYYDFVNEQSERRFSKNILDKFYKFFDEKPDEYYEKRLRKIAKSEDIFGAFFRGQREKYTLDLEGIAKITKVSVRQLQNIEANGINPNSQNFHNICRAYKISTQKRNAMMMAILAIENFKNVK